MFFHGSHKHIYLYWWDNSIYIIYILIKYISIRIKDRFKKGAKALNIFGEVICTIFFIACIVNIYIPGIVTYDPIIPQAA